LYSVRDHILEALLHRGATAEVWVARRLGARGFTSLVALKTFHGEATPARVSAFVAEARAAGCVDHRNVVQTRDLIVDEGRHWISMELVRGWSMRTMLATLDAAHARIPIPVALSLVRGAADGVQAIHDAGLVHGDLSQDNLMLSAGGQLMVLDFGRAAAPATAPVDPRVDVLSLGAMLDYMLPQRREAPVALDAIIRRAIDPDIRKRFASPRAFEAALDLVSIREGWLRTPSYVAAYLSDVLGAAAPVMPLPRFAAEAGQVTEAAREIEVVAPPRLAADFGPDLEPDDVDLDSELDAHLDAHLGPGAAAGVDAHVASHPSPGPTSDLAAYRASHRSPAPAPGLATHCASHRSPEPAPVADLEADLDSQLGPDLESDLAFDLPTGLASGRGSDPAPDVAPAIEPVAPAPRAVLPRGRGGMVGVGTTLAATPQPAAAAVMTAARVRR
jgi:hypothetical protein